MNRIALVVLCVACAPAYVRPAPAVLEAQRVAAAAAAPAAPPTAQDACGNDDTKACAERGKSAHSQPLLRAACDRGSAYACINLGAWLLRGDWGSKNPGEAFRLMERACSLHEDFGCEAVALMRIEGQGTMKDVARGIEELDRLCNAGQAHSCGLSGTNGQAFHTPAETKKLVSTGCENGRDGASCFELGRGLTGAARDEAFQKACRYRVPEGCSVAGDGPLRAGDLPAADRFYAQACDGGSMRGCLGRAAVAFRQKDYARAAQFDQQACDGGLQSGCLMVGVLTLQGLGVTYNPQKSASMFEAACTAGEARGCVARGWQYADLDKNPAMALQWYQTACTNDPKTCGTLAEVHYKAKNYAAAQAAWEKGAAAGDSSAMTSYGWMLFEGLGFKADPNRAAELASRACELGEPIACSNFGLALALGRGIPLDRERGLGMLKQYCQTEPQSCENMAIFHERGPKPNKVEALVEYGKACAAGNTEACDSERRVAQVLRKPIATPVPLQTPSSPRPADAKAAMPMLSLPSLRSLFSVF